MPNEHGRPIPQSYYYSGQGRLGIGDRDPTTGAYSNVIFPGNVTSLTLDIATEKTEHKESMSGLRSVDRTLITSQTSTFAFTAESLEKRLMAVGLFGSAVEIAAGTVAAEAHVVGEVGSAIPLQHPNVDEVEITVIPQGGGAGTPVPDTEFMVDPGFGTIYPKPGSTALVKGATINVAYEYGKRSNIEAFLSATPPERYLRFEGLNTDNGDLCIIEIPRAAFDPVTNRELINEEFGSAEFAGSILLDPTITAAGVSKFFREKRVSKADLLVPFE